VHVQRGSGHLTAPGVAGHCRAGEPWSARGSKPYRAGVYVSQHLSFARYGKATDGRPRPEPDWGNPTVRDRRGACGNVDHGGMRHPPRVSKERVLETLHLKLCAPQIYPDRDGLLGLLDRRALPHARGKPAAHVCLPRHIQQHVVRLAIAAVPKKRRRSWLISSTILIVSIGLTLTPARYTTEVIIDKIMAYGVLAEKACM
jgi:hypothetical protein